ncbi:g-type lectin s-receptor-like serine/threonine-protein kinase [Fagus crenata]
MKTFIIFLLVFLTISQIAYTISPGSTLYASFTNSTWLSPNSTFALGFLPLPLNPTTFMASIFYAGGVPIWTAGTTPVDSTASFQFLYSGSLRLVNGSGHIIWDSNTVSLGVSSASLDDSGKLILTNSTSTVWSSFDHPTDTIVPSQNFTTSMALHSGLYSFRLLNTGNLTLLWNGSITYYSQGLNSSYNGTLSSPRLGLQSIGILSIFDPSLPNVGAILSYSNDYAEGTDVIRFLRLDEDGNLRIYSSGRGNGIQTARWAAVEDQCEVFGYCGNMGICSYNDTAPVCGCPSLNFEPIDSKDSRKGCKRKVETQDCPGNATMLDLEHTQFLTYPPETQSQVFFVGISACRSNCLVNPTCDASTSLSDGTGQCYLKTPSFMSGYQSPALSSSSYIKVCSPVINNPSASEQAGGNGSGLRVHTWVVAIVVIGTVFGLVALEGSLWWWCCRNSPKFGALTAQYALLEYASGAPVQFTYKDLQRSTKGFKEKLGAGGFGAVYRVSGRRNFEVSAETDRKKFCVWAHEEFEKGNVKGILDRRLADQEIDMEQVMRAIQVSFWCIQEQPSHRPMMGKVVQMLEGIIEIEKPPAPNAGSEVSVNGTSINVSNNVSIYSTIAVSVPTTSSSFSVQATGVSPHASGRNLERASSSFLHSDPN